MVKKKIKKLPRRKKKVDAQEKELRLIIGSMVLVIGVFIAFSLVGQALKKFDYQGLEFSKEKFSDELDVYRHSYFYTNPENELIKYNLFVRIDPRDNNVPVEGEIDFPQGKFVYTSINSSLASCLDASRDYGGLVAFLTDNSLTVKGATPNEIEAEELGVKYATCENRLGNPVILIEEGNETKIVKEGVEGNCYRITINQCELLEATEKFKVQSVIDARKRAGL